MKKLLLSGLLFAAMSSGALAAEPLTEQQMDTVTAGLTANVYRLVFAQLTPLQFRVQDVLVVSVQ
jgi:hypothetical protein